MIASLLIVTLLLGSFFVLEPSVGRAVSDEFLVTQTVLGEISFVASTSDVTVDTSLASLSGGTARGTTTVVISTSDSDGYNMTIHFSTSTAMRRNGGNGVINNYTPSTVGVPDFVFNASTEIFGQFAFRVTGNTAAADVDSTFRDDGSDCNTGALNTYDACWFNSSTTPEMIINRTSPTPAGGATTTLNFRVYIPPNPNPTIPDGTYVATATLTAITN